MVSRDFSHVVSRDFSQLELERNKRDVRRKRRTVNDEQIDPVSNLSLPVLQLPALPVDPAPSSSTLELCLGERYVLGSSSGIDEDSSLSDLDERRLVQVGFLWKGRDEVSTVS